MISVQSDLLLPDRMMQTKINGWEKASKYRRKYGFTGNKNLRAIQFYGNSFFQQYAEQRHHRCCLSFENERILIGFYQRSLGAPVTWR